MIPADYTKLNLPPCRLKVRRRGDRFQVWDDLRGQWLVLTPEEWVRRHVIAYLCDTMGAERSLVVQEYPVCMDGLQLRADVVVMSSNGPGSAEGMLHPVMLVECKAPGVAISADTLRQAFRYNTCVGARYMVLTNGILHYVYELDCSTGEYRRLESFPQFQDR